MTENYGSIDCDMEAHIVTPFDGLNQAYVQGYSL